MEKEILFSLKGLQMSQEDQEELETIMAAEYYLRNDHHYIVYDEVMEGFEEGLLEDGQFKLEKIDGIEYFQV